MITPASDHLDALSQPALRWHRLSPVAPDDDALVALQRCLDDASFQRVLAEEALAGVYPARAMQALRSAGLAEILAERSTGPARFTTPHVYGLNASVARLSGSLGITVGVNMLGLLPVYLGASETQREELLARVRAGSAVALLLTEWSRGSDLKVNETFAERGTLQGGTFVPCEGAPTAYRVVGEKHLINGAAQSELLVTLVRTSAPASEDAPAGLLGATADMTVLVVSPGEAVSALERHDTLPMRGADIGGVRFAGAIVPAARRLGDEGEGFPLIQRALTFSRGGIGALASGTSSRALALAKSYARERVLYGAPIAALDPIAEHVLRADALDLAIACLSVKAACVVNVLGASAAHLTAIAKYACCELAEQVVDEGRRVLSSRALIAGDYEQLVRDVLLYAVFDGTRHVMLQQIQARLRQLALRPRATSEEQGVALLRRAYHARPARIAELGRRRELAYVSCPAAHARSLSALPGDVDVAPLLGLAEALRSVAVTLIERKVWQTDLEAGFVSARVLSMLEATFAVAELGDPVRRRALDLPAYAEPAAAARARYSVGLLAGRAASELRALASTHGIQAPEPLLRAEHELWAAIGDARPTLRAALREGT